MTVRERFRSAITGRFVRGSTADRHPRETVTEQSGTTHVTTWFVGEDMVEFAYAVAREPFPDAYNQQQATREHIRRRLGQWERGTWPR